ncbi:membrane-spanning 4-domains subfamily A member 8-like [Branchiostoma lanceolatum]|uniref:membrane-spanning 4-domains subfamily A member 8-like n=1 Tax=Branchiostoma lanceolatum TaxID=7740 RepID=UPI0034521ACC
MAGFPYGSARGLGGMQIFLGLAAMGLGSGDLVMGLTASRYASRYFFNFSILGTGIWTGLFFLIAGSLAASIREGRTAGCKIGAAQTMSLLNTFIFAPGLTGVTAMSVIWSYNEMVHGSYDIYGNYVYIYPGFRLMFYLEITLAVVGGLEFIFSIATASVCCCGGPYDQPAVNQVVPMPMMAFPTTMQQPVAPAPRPSYGFAERPGTSWNTGGPTTSVPPSGATGGDGQMVTLPAAELGVLYAKANNGAE